jgi:hypothetical protein
MKEESITEDKSSTNRDSWHGTTSKATVKNNKENIERIIIESKKQWNEGYGNLEEIGGRSEASSNIKEQESTFTSQDFSPQGQIPYRLHAI